jgi:tetratricopeptide (TPR) repeat protein
MFSAIRSRSVLLVAVLLLLAACPNLVAQEGKGVVSEEGNGDRVYQLALRATVHVHVRDNGRMRWHGTAWVVDAERKLLVTNHHVVGNHATVHVTFPEYRQGKVISDKRHYQFEHALPAVVLDSDPHSDLAIVKLKAPLPRGVEALKLASADPRPGQKVHLVGQPGASAGLWVYTTGPVRALVRRKLRYANNQQVNALMIDTQMAANHGDSGAAVINDEGEVVAVMSGGENSEKIHLMSWAIRLAELKPMLADVRALLDPETATAEAYSRRGLRYVVKGWPNHALADLNRALEKDDKLVSAYRRRARAWWLKRDCDSALADCNRALELDPKDAFTYNIRANTYQRKGDYDLAIADYTRALQLRPQDVVMRVNRGVSYELKGKLVEAARDYTEAIRLDPSYAPAYKRRGGIHYRYKNYQNAIEDYLMALKNDPNNPDILNHLGVAWVAQKQYEPAIEAYFLALKYKHPNPALVWRNIGNAYFGSRDYSRAIVAYNRAIELNPKDAPAFFWRGCAWEELGRGKEAHQDYTRAVALNPAYDAHAPLHTTRFFRVANHTGETLKVYVRYETFTTAKRWEWFPGGRGRWLTYTIPPGKVWDLYNDDWRIHARKVRILAVGQISNTRRAEYESRPLVLTEGAYRSRKKASYTHPIE